MKKSILKFAGSWKISDKEAEKLKEDIRKGWSSWNNKSTLIMKELKII